MFYALLGLGLLMDGAFLFRIVLFCAAVHEAGHILAYLICAKCLPKIACSAGGLCMSRTRSLSPKARLCVLCAGPLANLMLAGALYWRAQESASYLIYLIAAVSLCTGIYNLLPFGALDGAQFLEFWLPAAWLPLYGRIQCTALITLCCVLPICSLFSEWPVQARVAAVIAPLYLFLQNTLS